MNFALLGSDPDALQLAAAAVEAGHKIDWISDIRPADAEAVAQLAPGIATDPKWELVLDRGTADAVIVGYGTSSSELRAEQLKRIAAEATPLLVVQPACNSVLPYYEIDMTRREMGGLIRHYNPLADHPCIGQLAAWVKTGHPAVGAIHQITCERRAADTSRENVLKCLSRDVELLAAIAGDLKRVSAIGPGIGQPSFAGLQVQTTCASPASARWSVAPATGAEHDVTITLVGERGSVVLHTAEPNSTQGKHPWRLETISTGDRHEEILADYDAPRIALEKFLAAAQGDSQQRAAASNWDIATRAMEAVDAIELSLEKGRTLDVHQQQLTERLAFRGTMAAIGCGLLLLGFFVLVAASVFGVAEGDDRRKLFSSWPILLLALLAFFLFLQCAPLLIKKRHTPATSSSDTTKPPSP